MQASVLLPIPRRAFQTPPGCSPLPPLWKWLQRPRLGWGWGNGGGSLPRCRGAPWSQFFQPFGKLCKPVLLPSPRASSVRIAGRAKSLVCFCERVEQGKGDVGSGAGQKGKVCLSDGVHRQLSGDQTRNLGGGGGEAIEMGKQRVQVESPRPEVCRNTWWNM